MRRVARLLSLVMFTTILWAPGSPGRSAEPALAPVPVSAKSRDGNRLTYLDESNPWYPHRKFPRLITPQWVGEEGVECVVVLAIDDMREPAKYEAFLRPILNRLKQIDGRAPVSIMTCNVKPDDPQLAQWLAEGLSLEVHTLDHPCPLLQGGDLAKAKATYDRCVDLMNEIPGNKPVAFRMPCCDSLNTVSPRFYSEIFNKTTAKGNSLSISSSVFNLFTPNDPDVPRELVLDPDGRDKFRKYLPKGLVREGKTFDTFVNYIEDYPYPYIVNRLCWEFPCVVPSDWSAQHLQKPNNPDTLRDLKAALDITVLKQGVYNLVFHPHGWIKAEQIVELIDHAVATHGKKVKFLTFREAYDRLNRNALNGQGMGLAYFENGNRILDLNNDGYLDVILGGSLIGGSGRIGGTLLPQTRIWSPVRRAWRESNQPFALTVTVAHNAADLGPRFGILQPNGCTSFLIHHSFGTFSKPHPSTGAWHFIDEKWASDLSYLNGLGSEGRLTFPERGDGVRLRDIDSDGMCELLVDSPEVNAVFKHNTQQKTWQQLPFSLPKGTAISSKTPKPGPYIPDAGLRFVDIDEDGHDDIVFSNAERFGVYLFNDMQTGWSRVVVEGTRTVVAGLPTEFNLPPIVRADGTDNGFFVHSRHLFWQNEDTAKLPDLVDRRSFNDVLAQVPDLPPNAKSPEASFNSIRVRPGFKVELMAAEPLVLDPISFAFVRRQIVGRRNGGLSVGREGRRKGRGAAPRAPPLSKGGRGGRATIFADDRVHISPASFARQNVAGLTSAPEGVPSKPWDSTPPNPPLLRGRTGAASLLAKDARPSPLLKGGGQIRCLEDTDGDGRYDKATVFLEVPYPTGVLPWRKGILVTAAPDIFYAEDTDGDGKADRREVLYTGFVEGNQQHRVNGFTWGLDNWIYVANGDSGGVIESKKTGKKVNISGRDLRIRPDTGEHDAVTGQTQFGRSRDDWGNWFGCNNSNPMYQFVLDDALQRRNPHFPAPSPRNDVPEVAGNAPVFPISQLLARFNDFHTANRFTSACSAMIYRDDLFGPHFAGNAFICEPVHNIVHREVVTPKGVTFASRRAAGEEQSEFLASTDNWFRPTTVKTGPDGALWIADMYRHVIEHPQWIPDTWQKRLDLRAGHGQGHIYGVSPVDRKPRPLPRLDRLDTAGLVAALDSPSGWQRDVAQQLLVERQDQAAIPLLEAQAVSGQRPEARLHALCALEAYGPLRDRRRILVRALADPHPGVRRHAVRLTGKIPELAEDFEDYLAVLLKCEKDPDPHVRLQLAYTLGDLTGAASREQAGFAIGRMLVTADNDRFLFAALMSSVDKSNVDAVLSSVVTDLRSGAPNRNLIGTLLDLSAAFGNDQALAKLVQYVARETEGKFAEWQFTAFARLLDSLARRNETLEKKLTRSNIPGAEKLLASVDRLFDAARQLAADGEASIEARTAALQLVGRGRDQGESDLKLLAALLTPQTPPELQEAGVLALGRLRSDRVPPLLLDAWRGYGPSRRSQVLELLMSRDAWAAELTTAVANGHIAPTEFDAARRQRLLQHRSLDVRQKAGTAFSEGGVNSDRQKVVAQYQPALTLEGNVPRGAELFAKACAGCHKLAGAGHDVGPDLASLTDKSAEALLVAVLDPNRAVESKFLTYVAETKSGLVYTGLLASETGTSITLRIAEGKEQVVLRADLEELVSTSKSMMPEGLEKDLRPQDLADIIAHIRSNVPLPKRKEFPGNEPQPVTPAANGTLLLAASACEIYGSTLIFEPQYKNLGYWSSLDDHAVWTVEIVRPGKYAVEFDWACDASVAGNPWRLKSAGGNLTGVVESTRNWDTYRQKKVGEVTLAAGLQRIVLGPTERPQGAMIDLKAVRLKPID